MILHGLLGSPLFLIFGRETGSADSGGPTCFTLIVPGKNNKILIVSCYSIGRTRGNSTPKPGHIR